MSTYKSLVSNFFSQNRIKFSELTDQVLEVTYNANNLDTISVSLVFHDDNAPAVSFRTWLGTAPEGIASLVRSVCNELNKQYLWFKFYVNKDNEITVAYDTVINESNCGTLCIQFVQRMVNVADSAFPALASFIQ